MQSREIMPAILSAFYEHSNNLCITSRLSEAHHSVLYLRVSSVGSFRNNADWSFHLGYVMLLSDGEQKCAVLTSRLYKWQRQLRTVFPPQKCTLADALKEPLIVQKQLWKIYSRRRLVHMLANYNYYSMSWARGR